MTALFGDESGGWNIGIMTFAIVAIRPSAANRIVERYRTVSGLRGEVKGSRIGMIDRAFLLERMVAEDARCWVRTASRRDKGLGADDVQDLDVYAALLRQTTVAAVTAMERHRPHDDTLDVTIDTGRYDDGILAAMTGPLRRLVRADTVVTTHSHRSPGVQLADVVANCVYNVMMGSDRGARISAIIEPWLADGTLSVEPIRAMADRVVSHS